MSVVQSEVAVQASLLVAYVSLVAQVSLLARTDVTAVAAVFDRARRLAPRWVRRAFARVDALSSSGHRLKSMQTL